MEKTSRDVEVDLGKFAILRSPETQNLLAMARWLMKADPQTIIRALRERYARRSIGVGKKILATRHRSWRQDLPDKKGL
jgi:hypothetical protein